MPVEFDLFTRQNNADGPLVHSGNEKIILPRKHCWTVIGAALLALLALAAQVWFPPA